MLIEVTTTVASSTQARLLAEVLLRERLAACVQISTIESHYYWQGGLQHEPEFQLRIKTRQDRFAAISERLAAIHPYTVPQLLATAISDCTPAYAQWLHQQLEPPQ